MTIEDTPLISHRSRVGNHDYNEITIDVELLAEKASNEVETNWRRQSSVAV